MQSLRVQSIRFIGTTVVLITGGISGDVRAQATSPAPGHAVTWCTHPAPSTEWRRQTAYLSLAEQMGHWASSVEPRPPADSVVSLPRPVLGLMLEAVAKPFLHIGGLDTIEAAGQPVPAGEPRYRASMLLGHIDFRVRGDGQMDSVVLHDVVDSVLALDLKAALALARERGKFAAFGDTTEYRHFQLGTELYNDDSAATWPSFTIDAPIDKIAISHPDNPTLKYPPDLMAWNAELTLEFLIEADGTVRRGTVKSLPPSERFLKSSAEMRRAFARFEELTISGTRNWRYLPAEVLGCLVPQLVQQPFTYRVSK